MEKVYIIGKEWGALPAMVEMRILWRKGKPMVKVLRGKYQGGRFPSSVVVATAIPTL
jgi:hypothetical protein